MAGSRRSARFSDAEAVAMERGEEGGEVVRVGGEGQSHPPQEEVATERETSRVVAVEEEAVPVPTEEERSDRGWRRGWGSYSRRQGWCNLVVLGLVVGFGCIFVYSWVEAFREGVYNRAVGPVSVVFLAILACTCGYRRQIHSPTVEAEELDESAHLQSLRPQNFGGQWAQHQPKGVPLHVRQSFDYFVFTAPASPKVKEEPTIPKPAGTTGTAPAAASLGQTPSAGSEVGGDGGDGDSSVETASMEISAAAAAAAVLDQAAKAAAAAAATAAAAAVEVCVADDDKRENSSSVSVAVSPEKQHQCQQGRFAWASSSALTDCSVCLEAYRNGDRVCRLPCAHAFHAACIDTWLDQQHVCPQCRLDLLPPELSWGRSSQASAGGNPAHFASLFGSLERMILASHQQVAGGGGYGYSSSNVASNGAQGQAAAAASAASPYGPLFGSPAYGASPLSAVNSMVHHTRRSPEFFRSAGGGNGSRHRIVRAGASIAGSPATGPLPLHAHHYLASPAYTDASPLSAASSAVLFHTRGRTSPQFTTMGIRARGTPVPSGVGRFGMFPAVPSHGGGTGGGGPGGMAGPAGSGDPTSGHPPSTAQAPPQNQPALFRPVTASLHHHPHQHHQHHHTREGEPQHAAMPIPGGRDASRQATTAAGVVSLQHQTSTVTNTATMASPSPPPLLRLTPRRPRFAGGRSARPPTPAVPAAFSGVPAGGDGGSGGGDGSSQAFRELCGTGGGSAEGGGGGAGGGGSGPVGRTRSGSGHRRLRLPNLNGGRRRLRSRSNSYDHVPRSRSGSPSMFFLGNASPKAGGGGGGFGGGGGGGGGSLERRLSGAIWTGKGWPTPRRQQGMMESWDEVEDVSDITTRCRPGSEDWGGSGDWQPGAFEQAFRSGSSAAPAYTEQQYGPANFCAPPATAPTAVPQSEEAGVGRGGSSESRVPAPVHHDGNGHQHEQQQQQQQQSEQQVHEQGRDGGDVEPPLQRRQHQQLQHYHDGTPSDRNSNGGSSQRHQQPQTQQQQQSRVPHYHLSFDDETSESDDDSGSSGYDDDEDGDHSRHHNMNNNTTTTTNANRTNTEDNDDDDGSSYADSEELEDVDADANNAAGGRARGGSFWPMLYCQ